MSEPLLSVCLITYNHAEFIRQSIDSVFSQRVNFPWELVIADDCSTDGTPDILIEYQKLYPHVIQLILQKKNVGPSKNWIQLITKPKSKYIAYLEGDDFWISPDKLQKQVDFLEKNEDYSFCFHNAFILAGSKKELFNQKKLGILTPELLLKNWLIPSASTVFRSKLIHNIPKSIEIATHGDLALFFFLATKGKIKYFDEIMSVYRKHLSSVTSSGFKGIEHNNLHIEQCVVMDWESGNRYSSLFNERIKEYQLANAYLYSQQGNWRKSLRILFFAVMANIKFWNCIIPGLKIIFRLLLK